MLISVIMGIYNMKNVTLAKRSIDSLLNQTYENMEIIVCNDGSSNEEYSEIESYFLNDKRVVFIENEENMGLAFSLNRALEKAKGDLIARMDIDDTMDLEKFSKQVRFLEENEQYDFVGTNANLVDGDNIWGIVSVPEFPEVSDFYKNSPFIHASIMIKKRVLLSVGGYRVSKETRRAEDYDLWMRLYKASYRGANIQESLYNITEDEQAYSRRKYIYRLDEFIVRYKGYKNLGILFPKGIIYIFKPLIVGLIPTKLMIKLRGRRGK